MQRWIVLGVVAMMLVLGGGFFARRAYKQNRPQRIWVPLAINPALPVEKRDETARDLKAKLVRPEVLIPVCKELGLARKWQIHSDEDAAAELARRLFVEVGEADSPMGIKVPSINVGVTGKTKEAGLSGEIAMRMMKDVWKILGIKPPPQKEF